MTYAIADELDETPWRNLVVDPEALVSVELICGSWLALPWLVFNSFALGSRARRTDIALAVTHLASTAVLGIVLLWMIDTGVIESRTVIQVAMVGIATWKLTYAYVLARVQQSAFHVYELAGGAARNTMLITAIGFMLRDHVYGLSDHPLWEIVIGACW